MASRPRLLVCQVRFSTSFPATAIAHAYGCRMVRARISATADLPREVRVGHDVAALVDQVQAAELAEGIAVAAAGRRVVRRDGEFVAGERAGEHVEQTAQDGPFGFG